MWGPEEIRQKIAKGARALTREYQSVSNFYDYNHRQRITCVQESVTLLSLLTTEVVHQGELGGERDADAEDSSITHTRVLKGSEQELKKK